MIILHIILVLLLSNNYKINAQLLDKIIRIGKENCRFTKMSKYSNGDMIVSSYINPGDSLYPYCYGLKENGRPLFNIDNEETPIYNFNVQNFYYINYDNGESGIIKMVNSNEEYLINFCRLDLFTELYDFENNNIIFKETRALFTNSYISYLLYSIRGSLISLKETNNYLFAGIFVPFNNWMGPYYSIDKTYLILYSLSFNNKNSLSSDNSLIQKISEKIEVFGNMISCFQSKTKHIYCFYILSINNKQYKIIDYDENLAKKSEYAIINTQIIDENIFFKCIHYDKEIGIYIYFNKIDNQGPYPIISFKEKKDGKIEGYKTLNEIRLNSYIFNTSLYLNDFIELSSDYFCLASVSNNKEILYIVILNLFEETKIKIRYYIIETFEYHNYKFFLDLRLNMFKESLAMTSSYCNQTRCGDSDIHYSSLIIFSYPNSTDVNKDITEEIFNENKILEDLVFNFNFNNYISIENNIFGLIYSVINIQSIQNCEKVNLISSHNNVITIGYNLSNLEYINATFNGYDLFDCKIGYIYKVTEPDFEEFEKYSALKDAQYGDDQDIFNDNKKIYSGKLSYYNIYLKAHLTKDCSEDCLLCYESTDDTNLSNKNCLVKNCEYTIELDENNQPFKKCLEITQAPTEPPTEPLTEPPTEHPTEVPSEAPSETDKRTENEKGEETENVDKSTDKPLKAIDCIKEENEDCSHITVKNDEYQELEDQVRNKVLNTTTYQGEKKVFKTANVIIQVSRYDDQEDDEEQSNIDLGNCEQILKTKHSIPDDESLIIIKSDIKSNNSYSTYVQYKIFHPESLQPLDLSDCSEEQISISSYVNITAGTKYLCNNFSESGHDLFNKKDSFYNDICVTYTTKNGTDMSLSDRQHVIEDTGSSNFCQVGCSLQSFNCTTQKAKCDCNVKETKIITNLNDLEFNADLIINLFGGFKYSNYLVMKCYKLLMDFKLIQKNIGFIFMTIIFISLLVLFFIYICIGRRKIEYYIQTILKNRTIYINNKKTMRPTKKGENFKQKSKEGNNKSLTNKKGKINIQKNNKKNTISENGRKQPVEENNPPIKKGDLVKSKSKASQFPDSSSSLKNMSKSNDESNKNNIKNLNINIIPINNITYSKKKKLQNLTKIPKEENNNIKNNNKKDKGKVIKDKKGLNSDINIYNKLKYSKKSKSIKEKNLLLKKNKKEKTILHSDYINYQTLNIQELNNLQYNEAILVDKRSFFQYYFALIRKKQIIIFTFVPIEDYNLVSIKISLFLLSFSLYMTVNALFFTDYTMHQIYTNNGKMNLLQHIPQIIYSSLISSFINTILKQLSLSENSILSIKQTKLLKTAYKRSKEVKSYLYLKLIVYFIVSFSLTLFFWYYISCFCAVYTNTQIILIKDSLISFGVSMLYPFGTNLLPGLFRISALRAQKKDKICIYKLSQLLSLI